LRGPSVPTASTYGRSSSRRRRSGDGSGGFRNASSTPGATARTRSPGTPKRSTSSARTNSDGVITSRALRASRGISVRCQSR
jgi:hypothetical protein